MFVTADPPLLPNSTIYSGPPQTKERLMLTICCMEPCADCYSLVTEGLN